MTTWLIDKSALVRLAASPDAAGWAARIERGLVVTVTGVSAETFYLRVAAVISRGRRAGTRPYYQG